MFPPVCSVFRPVFSIPSIADPACKTENRSVNKLPGCRKKAMFSECSSASDFCRISLWIDLFNEVINKRQRLGYEHGLPEKICSMCLATVQNGSNVF
jgi:hypothetical protein